MYYVLDPGAMNVLKNDSPLLFKFLHVAISLFADSSILLLLVTGSILDHGSAPGLLVPLASVLFAVEIALS